MTNAVAGALRPVPIPSASTLRNDPVAQAFLLLRIAYGDIALRDFGLLLGALTLARLATVPIDDRSLRSRRM
jgi:hypothetical protein